MKIRMKTTAPGSVDGIRVATYNADTEYDLSATDGERSLAAVFVAAGMAERVAVDSIPPHDPMSVATDGGIEGGSSAGSPTQNGDMSKAELQAALAAQGISFPAAANKAALQALLDAAE
jgi:hypothetical protein